VQVFGVPGRLFGQMHEAVFDHRRLRVHARDFVRSRLVAGDGVQFILHQLLDQLGVGGLVFDQHDICLEGLALLTHRALRFGIFHALAHYMQQIEVLALALMKANQRVPAPRGRRTRSFGSTWGRSRGKLLLWMFYTRQWRSPMPELEMPIGLHSRTFIYVVARIALAQQ
jgi:hypothetical protein